MLQPSVALDNQRSKGGVSGTDTLKIFACIAKNHSMWSIMQNHSMLSIMLFLKCRGDIPPSSMVLLIVAITLYQIHQQICIKPIAPFFGNAKILKASIPQIPLDVSRVLLFSPLFLKINVVSESLICNTVSSFILGKASRQNKGLNSGTFPLSFQMQKHFC